MTASERPKLGAVLLAAGGSSRLGRPKQLLKLNGETLIRRAGRELADSIYFPVVVVLGAEADSSLTELDGLPVFSAVNKEWAFGMSTSIKKGVSELVDKEPDLNGLLIALCDQPLITTEMFDRFAAKYSETRSSVIASQYDQTVGVPALFARELFPLLMSLEGDQGARGIIRNCSDVEIIEMLEASMDIDTEQDVIRSEITNSE